MRRVYSESSVPGKKVRWEWYDDVRWVAYDIPTSEYIEHEHSAKNQLIDLSNTPLGIPNVVDFCHMRQINKHTSFPRQVQRLTRQAYPSDRYGMSVARKSQNKGRNASTANGYTTSNHRPLKTGGTGTGTKTSTQGRQTKKVKVKHSQGKIFTMLIP